MEWGRDGGEGWEEEGGRRELEGEGLEEEGGRGG